MFELELKDGNTFKVFKIDGNKAVIEYNGVTYDLESMLILLNEIEKTNSVVTTDEIRAFERDPEMRKIIEESGEDLRRRKTFSTDKVIKKIRNGVI